MSDVELAPAQLICGKGDCERANIALAAIRQIRAVWASDLNASDALDEIDAITEAALDVLESI